MSIVDTQFQGQGHRAFTDPNFGAEGQGPGLGPQGSGLRAFGYRRAGPVGPLRTGQQSNHERRLIILLAAIVGLSIGVVLWSVNNRNLLIQLTTEDSMKEAQQMETAVKQAAQRQILPCGIMIIGTELVSSKLLEIVQLIHQTVAPNEVACIRFRDDNLPVNAEGEKCHAKFDASAGTIVINTERHMDEVREALEAGQKASFRALYWETMLLTLGHEYNHAKLYLEADADIKDLLLGDEEHEEECTKLAKELLENLVKTGHDLEPPRVEEDPMMANEAKAFIDQVAQDGIDPWILDQVRWMDEGLMFIDDDNRKYMKFKSLLHAVSDTPDDPAWDTPTNTRVEQVETVITNQASTAEQTHDDGNPVTLEQLFEPPEATGTFSDEDEMVYAGMDADMDMGVMIDTAFGGGMVDLTNPAATAAMNRTATTITNHAGGGATVITPPPPAAGATATIATGSDKYVPTPFINNAGNAGGMGGPGLTPVVYNVPDIRHIPIPDQQKIVVSVCSLLFDHLFGKCGHNWANPAQPFLAPEAVMDGGVDISQIPNAELVFLEYDMGDQAIGLQTNIPCNTGIKGYVSKNIRLPGFSLWLNRGGQKKQFKFLPQNPNSAYKTGQRQGQPTDSAMRAREGWAMAWLMEETPRGQLSKYVMVIEAPPGQQRTFRWM